MSGENELKPCPFCGGNDLRESCPDGTDHWVACNSCQATGPARSFIRHAKNDWDRRATPPGTEVVPEGTVELLGKICARFREIEYQHELNHPHIGDGILYEMLEDLNNTLATDRRQNLDQP